MTSTDGTSERAGYIFCANCYNPNLGATWRSLSDLDGRSDGGVLANALTPLYDEIGRTRVLDSPSGIGFALHHEMNCLCHRF